MFRFGVVLAVAVLIAFASDEESLRKAISNLCAANKKGVFAECCAASFNGASVTLQDPQCFLSSISLNGGDRIEAIFFEGKEITVIPDNAFSSLSELSILGIMKNNLTFIPEGAFTGLTALNSLSLRENSLLSLPPDIFKTVSKLRVLNLGFNGLKSIPRVFHNLNSLKALIICDNHLTELPLNLFSSLSQLQYLDLGYNSMVSLSGYFTQLSNLVSLYLDGNLFQSIPDDVFSGQTMLRYLTISLNELTSLPSGIFEDLKGLNNLNVRVNSLTSLPENAFPVLKNIQSLLLDTNCLDCGHISEKLPSFECLDDEQNHCPAKFTCNRTMIWKGCSTCDSMNETAKCLSCFMGFKKTKKNSCQKCSEYQCCSGTIDGKDSVISNCVSCNANQTRCTECLPGYKLANGNCKKSQITSIIFVCIVAGLIVIGGIVFGIVYFIVYVSPLKKKTYAGLAEGSIEEL